MKQFLVYLAGPITGLSYLGATEWREEVKSLLPNHISSLSPMRGKQYLEKLSKEQSIADCYEDNPLTSEKGINIRDYNDCKRSDLIFVNFLGAKRVSIGTVMEIAWARAFQIPVVVVMEKDNIHNHAMLNYASGFIVETLDEGIDLIKIILGPDKTL